MGQFEDFGFRSGPDMSRSFTSGSFGLDPLNFPLCKVRHDPCHHCPLVGGWWQIMCPLLCKPCTEGPRALGSVLTALRQALAEASWGPNILCPLWRSHLDCFRLSPFLCVLETCGTRRNLTAFFHSSVHSFSFTNLLLAGHCAMTKTYPGPWRAHRVMLIGTSVTHSHTDAASPVSPYDLIHFVPYCAN